MQHRDINKIQAIIFMQRLYGYMLLLKYIQLIANYDNNGNLIQRRHKTTQLTTTYTYDYENRLIKINLPLGITAEYKYDPFGRRIEKNISNQITVKYLYDNEDIIIMEYATVIPTNTIITTKYIHGPGIDEPLAMLRNNKTYYYHADALGSITRMTDQNGNIVQTIKYDSFGNIKSVSNPFMIQPYAYTGREFDMESGFYYLRNRYYDPKTGRFISKDPIGFNAGDVNLFRYVGNNAVNFTDPYGLLAPPYHFVITLIAALNSGYGVKESLSLALDATAVDFGTQGQSPADTVQHAMAAAVGQTSAEAIAATNAYIQANINNGNLAGAIHAAQDLATPGHAGQPWHGFNWDWETAKHILGDVFPSLSTINRAYQNTKGILNPKGCSK